MCVVHDCWEMTAQGYESGVGYENIPSLPQRLFLCALTGIQNKVLESMAMGLPVVTTTRMAASMPNSFASFAFAANNAHRFAERVASVVASRFRSPQDRVRPLLALEYGRGRMAEKLENLLTTIPRAGAPDLSPRDAVAP
jgi:hypothetical protein